MTPPARGPRLGGTDRIRLAGAATLALLTVVVGLGPTWADRLQGFWFDMHQLLAPRQEQSFHVTVVAIDQKSLLALGQWPWPRTHLAKLVDTVNEAGAAAIGLNLLLSEPDALSPERLLAQTSISDTSVFAALAALDSNDARLAAALARAPAVLAVAGLPEAASAPVRAVPITVHAQGGAAAPAPELVTYVGALANIDLIDRQASGWGLISVGSTRGIFRRIPLVANISGTLVPTLAIEMLRVAVHARSLRLKLRGAAATEVDVGDLRIPTEGDGAVRVYFAPHREDRIVSAIDVLQGRVERAQLRGQLVLIGLTGVGLADALETPLGPMSGSEIHAQLLENIFSGTLLRRPSWAPLAEASLLLALGAALVWGVPQWRPLTGVLALPAVMAVPVLLGFLGFRWQHLLFDAALPDLALSMLFLVLIVMTLFESTRQRQLLQQVVQTQREQSARQAGELEAAQRIQTDSLPRAELLQHDHRVELHATLTPAREVGGDLYDFFMLDEHRLFVLVGDVAGKGLSASIFMTVSRALYRSAMLRSPRADIGEIMGVANAEVSRDNPQMLFVTVFAAILDLRSGDLNYCNAGHDNPYRLLPGRGAPWRIEDGDGPPLCALPDYAYRGAHSRLAVGEMLCLMTDGVAEAQNAAGELFGPERVVERLRQLGDLAAGARDVVLALNAEVSAFVADAEPADDLTLLALRWRGP